MEYPICAVDHWTDEVADVVTAPFGVDEHSARACAPQLQEKSAVVVAVSGRALGVDGYGPVAGRKSAGRGVKAVAGIEDGGDAVQRFSAQLGHALNRSRRTSSRPRGLHSPSKARRLYLDPSSVTPSGGRPATWATTAAKAST